MLIFLNHSCSLSTVPKPTVTFSGSLPFIELYSATAFSLTCIVELVPEVDTTVTILTTWRKDRHDIDYQHDRITGDTVATQNSSFIYIYESVLVFNPLSNLDTGGDSGQYTCSVTVKDGKYISGTNNTATQTLRVKGIPFICWHTINLIIHSLDLSPPLVNVKPKGNPTAGETYSFECSVETEKGVRSTDISITWTTPSGVTIKTENLTTNGTVTRGTLAFSPLNTSHSGEYICTGRVSAESVGVNVSSNFSIVVYVASKSMHSSKQSVIILYTQFQLPMCQ